MHGTRLSGGVIAALAAVLLAAGPASAAPAASSQAHPGFRMAPAVAAALPAPVPCSTSAGSCWQPPLAATWQYQLQGSVNSSGQCLYPSTGFINTAITGTSFATGQQVAPGVFDIDIYQDGKCYTPNNYGVLNSAAVSALHAQGDKVIGYIDAGTAETWRPDYPQYSSFNTSCGGCLFGKPVGGFRNEFWLNINTNVSGVNPNTGQTRNGAAVHHRRTLGAAGQGEVAGRGRDRVRQRRRLPKQDRPVHQRGNPGAIRRHDRQPGARQGVHGRPEKRPRPGQRPAAVLRFRDQRAMLAIQRVQLPGPGPAGVARHVRQGRVQRRIQAGHVEVLPAGQFAQLQLQLDTQERQPVRRPLHPLPLTTGWVTGSRSAPAGLRHRRLGVGRSMPCARSLP